MNDADYHVEARGLWKSYGATEAVRGTSLRIRRGEIHALVGENGAGKSTLGKMIAGAVRPSAGELLLDGRTVTRFTPLHALASGVAMVDQELAIVPARSAMDNVFLGTESGRWGVFRKRDQRRRFEELVQSSGFELDPDVPAGALAVAEQQKVEIMRALARRARLIVMDEPTASLNQAEFEQLYLVLERLRNRGTTILFVSHFLEEVLQVADTVTIMRDGRVVRTNSAAKETTDTLVEGMLGRPLELTFPNRNRVEPRKPVLEVRGLSSAGRFEDVSFTLNAGEIVGMAGLVGSGRTEVARAIFGADRVDRGDIVVDGEVLSLRRPRTAISRGVMLLPESRGEQGLMRWRSIKENLVMADLLSVSRMGLIRAGEECAKTRELVNSLGVRCSSVDAPVAELSGGNQQKVLFGKCVFRRPRVLILDEPTRGVDVGAQMAIRELIHTFVADGGAVLLISSELEEVLGLSHRVLVMRGGHLVATLTADEADKHTVLAIAFGREPSGRAA